MRARAEHWKHVRAAVGKREFRRRARRVMALRGRVVPPEVRADARWTEEHTRVYRSLGRACLVLYWIGPLAVVPPALALAYIVIPAAGALLDGEPRYAVPAPLWWPAFIGGSLGIVLASSGMSALIGLGLGLEFGGPELRRLLQRALWSGGSGAAVGALLILLALWIAPWFIPMPGYFFMLIAAILLPMPLLALLATVWGMRLVVREAALIDEVEQVLLEHAPLAPTPAR